MADLKTTNIYGDAYINNKVGIATNAPATRLQIGQLSPTAATEGIQFGDDPGTRVYRSAAGILTYSGSIEISANASLNGNYGNWTGEINKIQWHSNNLYLVNRGGGSWLFRNSSAANVFSIAADGGTSAAANINAGTYVYAGTYLQTNGNLIYPSGYGATQTLQVSNAANNAWIAGISIAPGGNVTVFNDLTANGNTYLGNANGDTVYVNDTIRIGATDSGDASLFFGEGSVAGSDYGVRWYWDSGYTFTWYTRNAGTDTALFDYVTNDTNYINWRRHFHMQNKEINYNAQIHFNAGTRFVGNNTSYLNFRSDSAGAGGILVQDGNATTKGYTGYWDSAGGGILNNTGNWAVRYNFGNANSGGQLYGDWSAANFTATTFTGTLNGNANAVSFTEVELNAPVTVSGTWTSGNGSEWGEPKFGTSFNQFRYTDGDGPYVEYNIPANHHACFISQLQWSSGGYADCHGVQSDGDLVFLRRINTRQLVENSNHGNPVQHDGATVTFVGSGLQAFSKIRITNRGGRIHMTGIAFTRQVDDGYEGTGMLHPAQISHQGAGSGLDADLLDGYGSATANTANTIVLRDGSGNFSAGTITAALSGNATTATALTSMNISQFTNNSGYLTSAVTSLAGTTNRITVSGATGAVTLNLPQDIHTGASPTFAGLSLTSVSTTGATITNLTGAYQNTTVYDSPRTQSATPSRGIRAPASSIQFTDSYAIAPFYTYRSTGDWPVPYGIGWGTGGESSGIFQRYASNGYSFGDMIFYTGNDGSGAFSFRRHTWEGTTYFAQGSGELNTELFRIDWSGNVSMLGTLNGSANSATLYANNGSYGAWAINGTRNGWGGIEFANNGVSLMMGSDTVGFHQNTNGWLFRVYNGSGFIYKGSWGGGTAATILDSSNYTTQVNGILLRAAGVPGAYADWNTFGNATQTTNGITQEFFNLNGGTGNSNFPPVVSYNYGLLLNLGSAADARAQIYISHAGNDLIFRGGWGTTSWQTWNKCLTNINQPYAFAMNQYVRTTDAPTFAGATFTTTSDYQITLNGGGTTWAGINWVDVNGSDQIWFNGQNKTFSIGGGGSNVSGKKLHIDGGVTIGADYDSTAVLANGLTVQGAVQIGNYTTIPINGLGAAGTQSRTFEIARIGIDYNDWNNIGTFEVELHEQYWSRGLKKVYNIWYGYVSNSGIRLVEWRGSGDNNFQCRIGSQVQISGDSYYLPVYVDVRNYGYVDVVIKTNRTITTNSSPPIGSTYVNTVPSATNISDFTADSDLEISTLGSAKLGGNTILTTATTSATGLSIGGNAATATTLQTGRAINGVSFNGSAAITVNGLNYNVNNDWLRENGDDDQFKLYGNSRTMIYRTDGNTNVHGGGAYAHIFYYGGSADANRMFIINTDGRLWSNYHGWLDAMNITGNAATATSADNIDGRPFVNTNSNSATNADTINSNGISYYTSGVTNFSGNSTDGALFSQAYSNDWQHQIAGDYRSGQIALRGKNSGTWQSWRRVLDETNASYAWNMNQNVRTTDTCSFAGLTVSNTINGSVTGNAGSVTYLPGRTDATAYPVLWGAAYTNAVGTIAYSCAAVTIQSSTGTLFATTFSGAGTSLTGTAASLSIGGNAVTAGGLAVHGGTNNEANKIVRTDGNGYINAGWINTPSGDMPDTQSINRIYCSDDQFIRYKGVADFKQQIGLTYKNATPRSANTTDTNYWTGIMGWTGTDWNSMSDWGCGFVDSWDTPANRPPVGTHHVGIQALHYTNGTARYGWQMAAGGGNNRWWLRDSWGSSFSTWFEILTSTNYTSFSPSLTGTGASGTWGISVTGNAVTAGGLAVQSGANYDANKIVRTDGNGYILAGWINTISGDNGTTAIDRVYASSDGYIRYYTPANFRTVLDVPTRNGSGVTNFGINTAPSNRLHINGDGTNPAIRVDNGAVVLAASAASNSKTFYGWLPISIAGTTKWIQMYN